MFNENYKKVNDIENYTNENYWVSYCDKSYDTKPSASEIRKMTKEFISKELSLIDIAKELQLGKTFCRVKLKNNHRHNDNFENFEFIWCDIDGEYSVNEFLDICNKYELIPSILYPTFSDTGTFTRFRAIFKLNNPNSDERDWVTISYMINFLFGFKDNSNTSLSQQYHGTNKDVYVFNHYKDYTINLENILLATMQKLNSIDSREARKELHKLRKKTGVNANSKNINTITINGEIALEYLIEHEEFKKLKEKYKTNVYVDKLPKGKRPDYQVNRVDIDVLVDRCELMRRLINKEYLNHYERTYLGNMFYYIEYIQRGEDVYRGFNLYEKLLELLVPKWQEISQKLNDPMSKSYKEVLESINGVNRSGIIWNCEKSCSLYYSCKNNCKNILSLCKVKAPTRNNTSIETSKLSDIEKSFRRDYYNLISNADNYKKRKTQVSIFNVETGIGKTEVIVNTKYNVPTIIAVPTHSLKEELYKRMVEANANKQEDILIIPERPDIEDEMIEYMISNYERNGLYGHAHALYNDYAKNQFELGNTSHMEYLNTMKDIKNTPHIIAITTHMRVIVSSDLTEKYNNIIFDEDPSDNMIVSKSALFDDINRLEAIGRKNNWKEWDIEQVKRFKEIINSSIEDNELFVKVFCGGWGKYMPSFKDIPFNEMPRTNIMEAMEHDTHIYIDITNPNGTTLNYMYDYKVNDKLNLKSITILSATPNMAKINKIFKEADIYKYEYLRCERNGFIMQDLSYSFSKNGLNNKFDKLINHIDKNHENKTDLVLITYMKHKSQFEKYGFNVDDLVHFGNCEGYDHLKGKDLIIVGRMYAPQEYYKLMSWYLGDIEQEEINSLDFIDRRMSINGFDINIHCFNNDEVNKHLFYDIEKNLEQAIGRARALREKCNVYIYTNYPIALANEYKYLDDIV